MAMAKTPSLNASSRPVSRAMRASSVTLSFVAMLPPFDAAVVTHAPHVNRDRLRCAAASLDTRRTSPSRDVNWRSLLTIDARDYRSNGQVRPFRQFHGTFAWLGASRPGEISHEYACDLAGPHQADGISRKIARPDV